MDSWKLHTTKMLSLKARAENLEHDMGFSRYVKHDLSPSKTLDLMSRAKDIRKLYLQAARMCKILQETRDPEAPDLTRTCRSLEDSVRRLDDAIETLDEKAARWGLQEEEAPPTLLQPSMFEDVQHADDEDSEDDMRAEVREMLRDLLQITNYMEKPLLVKIHDMLEGLSN